MLQFCRPAIPSLRCYTTHKPLISHRQKSFQAVIERGIRQSEHRKDSRRQPRDSPTNQNNSLERRRDSRRASWSGDSPRGSQYDQSSSPRGLRFRRDRQEHAPVRRDLSARDQDNQQDRTSSRRESYFHDSRNNRRSFGRSSEHGKGARPISRRPIPESLPYTTAASQFIYGYSSVFAAVKANHRQLYNLYIHSQGLNNDGVDRLLAAARVADLKIHKVEDEYTGAMSKASNGRPHNGFILEASPLPNPPIKELATTSMANNNFRVVLDSQSREDAAINGKRTEYTYKSSGWRHPLVLYLDGVLDEGNLGAIARSAYFLGVDAIVTPTRQSAPWSQITLKASAGAAEAVPIFTVAAPAQFINRSAGNGWHIYASDAVPYYASKSPSTGENTTATPSKVSIIRRGKGPVEAGFSPLATHPTILMMGGEGSGLRDILLQAAHYKVGIRSTREVDEIGVDSLNVSVAAALLCFEFLQKPAVQKSADALF
ncbi:hypothetical protein BU24DRAFT_10846 [Aaosphaeria arxii CBS 175.79]|uniref:rRNA methyltransferase 1, mitochondrial n=1 Tax=Aaosphaeria arxii CBS 175.79 TaxID=1450172 RepID=A0A6A5Y6I5_9PLEO|nr:uncharacterized protein BU24DRAFT_10846 [Aaosphaeria arxii CBS 175.79]KAF2020909.1 hypothetical protein BU24DRAFT_10846 [Aaosphaeria arxii CBS 175.79]